MIIDNIIPGFYIAIIAESLFVKTLCAHCFQATEHINITTKFTGLDKKLPNVIFLLLDDQDVFLGGMEPMDKTERLVKKEGIEFANMFVTTPLCCPSRSSILTGQYAHTHQTRNNSLSGQCSSILWQKGPEKASFATYIKKQNYTTFYAGKYLNQYGDSSAGGVGHIPPGWDWWIGLVGNSQYYNYTLSVNGSAEYHGDNPNKDYLTNVIAMKTVEFLKRHSASNSPFFMMLSPPAPHAPFTPEQKYKNKFQGQTAPRNPSFNVTFGKTKHWLLQQVPEYLPPSVIEQIDEVFRNRWRTLLSVDDLVETVIKVLEELNMLTSTFIFVTSDNGFHLGQFCLPWDKRQPYEFDIRVPLFVRGPGISPGLVKLPILNIDLAPTFMELAGLNPSGKMDGESFLPVLYGKTPDDWRKYFLVEHQGEGSPGPQPGCPQFNTGGVKNCMPDCICQDSWNNTYSCIRTLSAENDSLMCSFQDQEHFVEFYNMTSDPYQLKNVRPLKMDWYQMHFQMQKILHLQMSSN